MHFTIETLFRIENATKKVLKDVKKYEDLILGMFKISAIHVSISIHIHRQLYQVLFSLELSISEKAMTEDLSGSLLCQEEEKLRSLIEEWHTFVSQSAASNEDLV